MSENGRRRARVGATLAATVLGVSGVAALVAATLAQESAPPTVIGAAAPTSGQPSHSHAEPSGDAGTASEGAVGIPSRTGGKHDAAAGPGAGSDKLSGPQLPESSPVRVAIPGLGVSSAVVDLGLNLNGTMEVPQDPAEVGWYVGSHSPGGNGAAVLAGHVTWDRAPAVFFRLGDLRRGDRVEVTREDGRTAVFEVRRVARFPKDEFPTDAVYGQVDQPSLRLITCGGAYDESANRYLDNVIVWADMVGSHRAEA